MRIAGSQTFNRTQLVTLESDPAMSDQAKKQQQLRQANDCYTRNAASAQIIDAEYIDAYSPEHPVTPQQQGINNIFEPVVLLTSAAKQAYHQPAISKYQGQVSDTPPPGTYINYFA